MALWPVAETLGLGMEQTQQSKHSVSTWDVMKMKKKAIPQIVPTDNSVLIFFFKEIYDLFLQSKTKSHVYWFALVAINCPLQSLVHLHPFIFMGWSHTKL